MLAAAYDESRLPKGVLNLVTGDGSKVGNVIVEDPRIKAISFTGSNTVGTCLYQQAAQRMCRVQWELSGKNPVIVLEDADLERAATDVALSAYGSSGQRCTATSRAVVEPTIFVGVKPKMSTAQEKVLDRSSRSCPPTTSQTR